MRDDASIPGLQFQVTRHQIDDELVDGRVGGMKGMAADVEHGPAELNAAAKAAHPVLRLEDDRILTMEMGGGQPGGTGTQHQ